MKTTQQIIVLVEDRASVQHALDRPEISEARSSGDLLWATQSPAVQEKLLRENEKFIALDGEVSQDKANEVGYAALRLSREFAERIEIHSEREGLLPIGASLRFLMHRTLTGLIYKAYLLDHVLRGRHQGARVIIVGRPVLADPVGFNPMLDRFEALYCVIGAAIGVEIIDYDAPRPLPTFETGDYLKPTMWSRLCTIMNSSPVFLIFRFWQHVLKGRRVRLPWKKETITAYIHSGNELTGEIWWHLIRRGVALSMLPKPKKNGQASVGEHEQNAFDAMDWESIAGDLSQAVRGTGVEDDKISGAIADIFVARLKQVLRHGVVDAHRMGEYARVISRLDQGPIAVLSNGLSSGQSGLLRAGLDRQKVPSFIVEHGVSPGLTEMHDATMRSISPEMIRDTLYWTPMQKQHAVEQGGMSQDKAVVTGIPRQIRNIGFKSIQRHVVRRDFKAQGRLVCWCTALYPNNLQFLPHYYRDTPYHELRKKIVFDVMAKADATVLFKLYPTYRYKDPEPFASEIELPNNFRIEQFKDFRALRAGVDILVIDGPGSVLAWGWCVDVPFVFLETGMCTLRPEVKEMFKAATFYIDTRDPGWEDKMLSVLNMPDDEIQKAYEAMKPARDILAARCIVGGVDNPGAVGAEYIIKRTTECFESQSL